MFSWFFVRLEDEKGGIAEAGDGTLGDSSIAETTIHCPLVVNGLPVITPGEGELAK